MTEGEGISSITIPKKYRRNVLPNQTPSAKIVMFFLIIRERVLDVAMQNRTEGSISSKGRKGKGSKHAKPPEALRGVRNHMEKVFNA
nr:unnamed protein product [Callosobruchus chinensis]